MQIDTQSARVQDLSTSEGTLRGLRMADAVLGTGGSPDGRVASRNRPRAALITLALSPCDIGTAHIWRALTTDERRNAAWHLVGWQAFTLRPFLIERLAQLLQIPSEKAAGLPRRELADAVAGFTDYDERICHWLLVGLHLGERSKLVTRFLDQLGLPHKSGRVLPGAAPVSREMLAGAIELVSAAWDMDAVVTYVLFLFNLNRAAFAAAEDWLRDWASTEASLNVSTSATPESDDALETYCEELRRELTAYRASVAGAINCLTECVRSLERDARISEGLDWTIIDQLPSQYEALRRSVELIAGRSPDISDVGGLRRGVSQLEEIVEAALTAIHGRQRRRRAIEILERATRLRHRYEHSFAPLETALAHARLLLDAATSRSASMSVSAAEIDRVAEGEHPLARLVVAVSATPVNEDQAERDFEEIAASFGRSMAIALPRLSISDIAPEAGR